MNRLLAAALALVLAAPAAAMGRRAPKAARGDAMEAAKGLVPGELTPNEWRGAFSGVNEPSARLVTSLQDWTKLWREGMNQVAPEVDFSKYFAVTVFLGTKPTGGFTVEFLEPMTDGQEIILRYKVHKPSQRSFVIQAFTQPYAIQLYRRSELKVTLAEVKE